MTLSGWTSTHYYRVVKHRFGYRWYLYRAIPHRHLPNEPTIGPLIRHGWAWTEPQGLRRAIDAINHPRQRRHHPRPVDVHHRQRPG